MNFKKIEAKEDREKKDRRNKTIIGIILAVLMLMSTAGYAFFSMEKTDTGGGGEVKYNGVSFVSQEGFWRAEIQGSTFYFHYLPNETQSKSLGNIKKTLSDYSGKPLYLAGDSEAWPEIAINLNSFVLRVQDACLRGENCTNDLPVKNCSDNMIVVRNQESGVKAILEEDNCVFILSNDSLRDVDAFLYRILGVN